MFDLTNSKRISSNDFSVLNLDRVVFIGRTFSEYMWMFNLDPSYLKSLKILDCPSGASSFVAEATNDYGIDTVVGCDLLYSDDNIDDLERKGKKDLQYMVDRLSEVPQFYNWNIYTSYQDLYNARNKSLERFISDYRLNTQLVKSNIRKNNKYVKSKLPNLTFADNSFDLALSSNFLFYYHNMFDFSFHLDSILELLRVASQQVRIYPVQKPDATLPQYLDNLLDLIKKRSKKNISFKIEKVKYEFRRGVNQMLLINCF